jgi:GNAT superfamily N-acetyltransferase
MLELATYEKLDHIFVTDADALRQWLFASPVVSALVAEVEGAMVGYAIYYRSFSSFLGRPGCWLEDLYVSPEHRGTGIGKGLLTELARLAVENAYGRVEWAVLDWNQPAIDFYERIGADVMPDWRLCRLTGEKLAAFAAKSPA